MVAWICGAPAGPVNWPLSVIGVVVGAVLLGWGTVWGRRRV